MPVAVIAARDERDAPPAGSSMPAIVALARLGRSLGFASGIAIDPCGAMHANTAAFGASMRA
jgi:hypothetical protein